MNDSDLIWESYMNSQYDAEYAAAYEAGDEKKAQELVDKAAEAAGYKILYHGTTENNKKQIESSGFLKPEAEPAVYLTTDPTGGGYGDGSVVRLAVPESRIEIDDEFPDGREDYRVEVGYKGKLQVKSANPFTFDQSGKLIPLSKRFN